MRQGGRRSRAAGTNELLKLFFLRTQVQDQEGLKGALDEGLGWRAGSLFLCWEGKDEPEIHKHTGKVIIQ